MELLAAAFIFMELTLQDVTRIILRTPTEYLPSTSLFFAAQPLTVSSTCTVREFLGCRIEASAILHIMNVYSHRSYKLGKEFRRFKN